MNVVVAVAKWSLVELHKRVKDSVQRAGICQTGYSDLVETSRGISYRFKEAEPIES